MIDQIKLQKLIELGVRDAECARIVKCSREYVRQWKYQNGYEQPTTEYEELFHKFYTEGMTDNEISINSGATYYSVRNWRIGLGLPLNRKNEMEKRHQEFLNYYNQGLNDNEISRKMQLHTQRIYNWRTKNNLPKNNTRGAKLAQQQPERSPPHVSLDRKNG